MYQNNTNTQRMIAITLKYVIWEKFINAKTLYMKYQTRTTTIFIKYSISIQLKWSVKIHFFCTIAHVDDDVLI